MNSRSVDLLKLLKNTGRTVQGLGLMTVTVITAAPDPVTVKFDGTNLALDLEIFVVATALQPLQAGAKYFALPMSGAGDSQRWGIVQAVDVAAIPGATGATGATGPPGPIGVTGTQGPAGTAGTVIPAGTTAQYYRGDKTWQTLDKAAAELANVDNTTDALKPISAAQQTALDLKANKAQPPWITPTLLNGWVNFDVSTDNATYYKDSLGWVHIRGVVSSGTISLPIFNLPAGYRPLKNQHRIEANNNNFAVIVFKPNGDVLVEAGINAWLTIEATFKAEQ